ncbi:MerR family transcriptional regulator [Aestuariimicrobium ganziense]|uniref:MerR family transcriptional regulator n=1 Tax=Aestuariimicrobium ganziense TaxID=2773677 RepID=UPI0019426639|nr:MerR family transcriptional regulator [Aestuariimicrobium ganziense]
METPPARDLSIGDVAAAAGISASTLRSWEVRYQLVDPIRSEGLTRRYTQAQLETVRTMKHLVDSGLPARKAAAMLQKAPLANSRLALSGPLDDPLLLVRHSTAPAQLRRVIDEVFASAPFETVLSTWLMPNLRNVGHAWAEGHLDIATEHLISIQIRHKLGTLLDALPSDGPRVLVGLPAAARHEIPSLALAICLRRRHVDAQFLGADTPDESWASACDMFAPRAIVLGTLMRADTHSAASAIQACAGRVPLMFVGGPQMPKTKVATQLPQDIPMAADVIASALASWSRPLHNTSAAEPESPQSTSQQLRSHQ